MWEHGEMLGECSTRCHLKMWSLGMPYLEDVPCMGMAENMIKAMPCKRAVGAWMALLSACKIHDTVEMGEPVAKRILELEPKNTVG
ncbi:unnamed protein product [Sphagnum jensenii]|uniref:Uncharacterized protein n=1 Tax=Sphagnum jensenii TaxID=128206 RepID=A0ABP0WFW6_9BRYO